MSRPASRRRRGSGRDGLAASSASVPLYKRAQELEQLSRTEADRKKNAPQIAAIKGQLSDARFVTGFGSIGGEEFFSYLNISDSLHRTGGPEWEKWNGDIKAKVVKMQNEDGTWAGHHCITGRVAVTSAAILTLLSDREPATVTSSTEELMARDLDRGAAAAPRPAVVETERPALARGAAYLWSRQAGDGGWHSQTYGLLRSGQSLTPFVLEALLEVPDGDLSAAARRRWTARSRSSAPAPKPTARWGWRRETGIPDYPNYSTALAVSALCRARRAGWEAQVKPMLAYLRAQQFTEQNGWRPADPAYGAWGMGGERRTPPDTGHVDLSMTRYVIEALRAAGAAGVRSGAGVRARVRRALPEFRSASAMAASSSPPPNSTPTKPGTTASNSAATARPPPTASWRCWPRSASETTRASPPPGDG